MRKTFFWKILAILCVITLVSGVSATTPKPFYPTEAEKKTYDQVPFLTYNSIQDQYAIYQTYINVNPGSNINISLTFNNGATTTAWITYNLENYGLTDTLTISMAGSTETRSGPHVPGINPSIRIGYALVNDTVFLMMMCDTLYYAILDTPQVFADVGAPSQNPWVQIDIVSQNQPFSAQIHLATMEDIANSETEWEQGSSNLVSWLLDNYLAIWGLIVLIWSIFYFVFIENLMLTIILIEGGIIAYRFCTAPDIFIAFSQVIQDNERLISGLIWFVSKLIKLIWDIVNFLNPLRWITG